MKKATRSPNGPHPLGAGRAKGASARVNFAVTAAALAVFFVPSLAHAHITLTDPPARHPPADQKDGPCGTGPGDSRTTDPQKITEYTAGETITIEFTETIQHASTYRVMLSRTGDSGFINPTSFEDTTLDEASGELADGIEDLTPLSPPNTPEDHTIEVTLPDEPCEECTLQLIQLMREGAFDADSIYYQCADIVILPGAGGGSGGASSGGASGSGGDVGSGGGLTTGGTDGSGGVATGTGGASGSSGGATSASGGDSAAGGSVAVSSGGSVGSGGGGATPPAMPPGCSLSGGMQAGGVGFQGTAGWLGLAGLGWLAFRRRRAQA
jgi:MYXO-CTERM domain-containing protein